MYTQNQEAVIQCIRESDLVLDIGGGAQPLRRANKVIDFVPYKERGSYGYIGNTPEYFTKDDWIVRDLCEKKPLPFKDKEFDFVFCSHVLEDLRDPVWVCSEIVRVGKRGYIEVPSRAAESAKGIENYKYCGYYHHRWLIEYKNEELIFLYKSGMLNTDRNYLNMLVSSPLIGFFWEDSFKFKEEIIIEIGDIKANFANFANLERKKMSFVQKCENELLYLFPYLLRIKMLFR